MDTPKRKERTAIVTPKSNKRSKYLDLLKEALEQETHTAACINDIPSFLQNINEKKNMGLKAMFKMKNSSWCLFQNPLLTKILKKF
jgi:hypothetical protein